MSFIVSVQPELNVIHAEATSNRFCLQSPPRECPLLAKVWVTPNVVAAVASPGGWVQVPGGGAVNVPRMAQRHVVMV